MYTLCADAALLVCTLYVVRDEEESPTSIRRLYYTTYIIYLILQIQNFFLHDII